MSILDPTNNRLCKLLNISLPIIQAGMVYVSGANLAAASAETGVLGCIGAGSMSLELLKHQIRKAKSATNKPLAVNIPLLYSKVEEQVEIALAEGIRIFITSAGSPKKLTPLLKQNQCTVIHVVSSPILAKKCEDAGVDAIVAEGFEAGGHNGRDELTTLVLIPEVVKSVKIPVIAAGGIATGGGIVAAFALGADGAQIGSRFAITQESSAHENFKNAVKNAGPDATELCMKALTPVRLLKNAFYEKVKECEKETDSVTKLTELLGKGRARKGMLDGDLVEGELEIGQVSGLIDDIPTVADLVERLKNEVSTVLKRLNQ